MISEKPKFDFPKLAAVMAALALVLSACSSKTDDKAETTTTVAEVTETTEADDDGVGPAADRLVPSDGVEIGKTAQYAGWSFDFEELTSDEDDSEEESGFETTTELDISFKYTNLLPEADAPSVPMAIEIEDDDGTVELIDWSDRDANDVPGDGTGKGSVSFVLDEDRAAEFSLDAATLVLGDGSDVQARVPLGDNGDLVSLEPQEQTPGFEKFTIGDWTFIPESTELRWDSPRTRTVPDTDTTWLLVMFTIEPGDKKMYTNASNFQWSGLLPDGTSIVADDFYQMPDGRAIDIGPDTTAKNMALWFHLETPVDGEYEFKLAGEFKDDSDAEVSETFKIDLKASDSGDTDGADGDEDTGGTEGTDDEDADTTTDGKDD